MDASRKTVLYCGFFPHMGKRVHMHIIPSVVCIDLVEHCPVDSLKCPEFNIPTHHCPTCPEVPKTKIVIEVEPLLLPSEVKKFNETLQKIYNLDESCHWDWEKVMDEEVGTFCYAMGSIDFIFTQLSATKFTAGRKFEVSDIRNPLLVRID